MTPCTSVGLLLDLAGLDARRAGVEPAGRAVHDGPHTLDVRVPPAAGASVRVADGHAERRLLATHFAYRCHDGGPLRETGEQDDPDPPRSRVMVRRAYRSGLPAPQSGAAVRGPAGRAP